MSAKHDFKEAGELWIKANKLWDDGHNDEAFHRLLSLARKNHAHSQNSAGFFLDHGIGVEKS